MILTPVPLRDGVGERCAAGDDRALGVVREQALQASHVAAADRLARRERERVVAIELQRGASALDASGLSLAEPVARAGRVLRRPERRA